MCMHTYIHGGHVDMCEKIYIYKYICTTDLIFYDLGRSRHQIWVSWCSKTTFKTEYIGVMATNRLTWNSSPPKLFISLLQLDILLLDIGGRVRILKEYSHSCS